MFATFSFIYLPTVVFTLFFYCLLPFRSVYITLESEGKKTLFPSSVSIFYPDRYRFKGKYLCSKAMVQKLFKTTSAMFLRKTWKLQRSEGHWTVHPENQLRLSSITFQFWISCNFDLFIDIRFGLMLSTLYTIPSSCKWGNEVVTNPFKPKTPDLSHGERKDLPIEAPREKGSVQIVLPTWGHLFRLIVFELVLFYEFSVIPSIFAFHFIPTHAPNFLFVWRNS